MENQEGKKSNKVVVVRLLLFLALLAILGALYYQTFTLQKQVKDLTVRVNEVNSKLAATPTPLPVTPTATPSPVLKVTKKLPFSTK